MLLSLPFLAALLWKPGLFQPSLQGSRKVKAITLQPFPAPSSPGAGSRSTHIPSQPSHVAPHAIPNLEHRWHESHGWGGQAAGMGYLAGGTREAGLRSWGTRGTELLELGEVGEMGGRSQ